MKINKFGAVNKMELTPNKLLIFTGKNNSGKTYTSYLLYGILSSLAENQFFKVISSKKLLEFIVDDDQRAITISKESVKIKYIEQAINFIDEHLIDILVKNFKINEKNFDRFKHEITKEDIESFLGDFCNKSPKNISINNVKLKTTYNEGQYVIEKEGEFTYEIINSVRTDRFFKELLTDQLSNNLIKIPKVFYFPAERNGINVFKNELNENRLKTYDTIMNTLQYSKLKSKKDKEKMRKELLQQNLDLFFETQSNSVYPKPISDYINFLNSMRPDYESKSQNIKLENISNYIRDDIIHGKYEINSKDNTVTFRQKMGKTRYKAPLPFHVVSSSVKTLYGLDYYLDNVVKDGDFLIIDEPELSLHPENQIKLANVIAMIADCGIKVILSTHSDLFIRSLINILLKNKIERNQLLSENDITIYNFNKGNVEAYKDVLKISYFDNFDDSVMQLQDEYNNYLEELDIF
ncbi:AAA family ATPase [Streptococcus pasteurianus]|uniref:AAA family ATPase n=1 Tax=Streptococcus pasteurianus TaxID=197614 RepID=UPI002553F9B9|nr:AAA family ATPase [Streptococcus pasteurianus]MDK8393596.1 AAA family ATPase [Streptococcus pasteurianus]